MKAVRCGVCGSRMELMESEQFRHKDGRPRKFYVCSNILFCSARHGAHSDGRPLGIPGDEETKRARIDAHEALDRVCKKQGWSRNRGYAWLAQKMSLTRKACHMGKMDKSQCQLVVEICITLTSEPES